MSILMKALASTVVIAATCVATHRAAIARERNMIVKYQGADALKTYDTIRERATLSYRVSQFLHGSKNTSDSSC